MTKIRKFNGGTIKIDIDKLDIVRRALSSKMRVQVGILGNKSTNRMLTAYGTKGSYITKHPSQLTNAEIGLKHEKGSYSERIPRRSFLEMPLVTKAEDLLGVKTRLFKAFNASKISLKKAFQWMGFKAEEIIQSAFESHGFGTWAPNSPATIAMKGSDSPLIDTAQMRGAVSSRVVGSDVE